MQRLSIWMQRLHATSIYLHANPNIISVNITDAVGRNVETLHATSLPDNQLDIRHLQSGIYWVKIQTIEGMAVQKLVKK